VIVADIKMGAMRVAERMEACCEIDYWICWAKFFCGRNAARSWKTEAACNEIINRNVVVLMAPMMERIIFGIFFYG
jgi:hypothetical protein